MVSEVFMMQVAVHSEGMADNLKDLVLYEPLKQ